MYSFMDHSENGDRSLVLLLGNALDLRVSWFSPEESGPEIENFAQDFCRLDVLIGHNMTGPAVQPIIANGECACRAGADFGKR